MAEIIPRLYGTGQEIQERANGNAFRLTNDSDILMLAAEAVYMEWLCYTFMRYTLELEPNRGPFWLRFTGGEGVKEYLRLAFEEANVFNEQVAEAAGLNVAVRMEMVSVDTVIKIVDRINQNFAQVHATSVEG